MTSLPLNDDFDSSTQISVALSSEALTIDPSEWDVFTHIDFIVSSQDYKDSIRANGISNTSVDITGQYSSDSHGEPYIAASIPFGYFVPTGKSARLSENSPNYEETFIKFIIGNGKCPEEKIAACQNDALRTETTYVYEFVNALSIGKHDLYFLFFFWKIWMNESMNM